jgi:hypothetical protein
MIIIDLSKAKIIAHDIRRARRADAFKPIDEAIARRIPGTDIDELETKRQSIRDSDEKLQNKINAVKSVEKLIEAMQ